MSGERLSELRKDKGLKQKELAQILGISENSVSLYERNFVTPDDDMKVKIAKYFNVSLDYLLDATDKQLTLDRNPTKVILVKDLPESVERELEKYLSSLKTKYNL